MSGDSRIVDASSGNAAAVGSDGRLHTQAVSKSAAIDSSIKGETFFITTGSINLTDDTESWLLYVKNEDTVNWIVDSIAAVYGKSDGSGDAFNQFNVGATEGTLIDEGIDLPAINLNIGSSKQLPATIKLGGQGKTITNGINTPKTLVPEGLLTRVFPAGPVIIPPGTIFAVAYTPPPGNTSQNTTIQTVIYKESNDG